MAGPTPTSNWVLNNKKLLAGALPGYKEDEKEHERLIQCLLDAGVYYWISLQEVEEMKEFRQYHSTVLKLAPDTIASTQFINWPIPDRKITSVERVQRMLQELDAYLSTGKVVFIHCQGGHGRTGEIVSAWLMSKNQVSANSALKMWYTSHNKREDQSWKKKVHKGKLTAAQRRQLNYLETILLNKPITADSTLPIDDEQQQPKTKKRRIVKE
jgi:protein-tyrosine phosphatase